MFISETMAAMLEELKKRRNNPTEEVKFWKETVETITFTPEELGCTIGCSKTLICDYMEKLEVFEVVKYVHKCASRAQTNTIEVRFDLVQRLLNGEMV